MYIKQSGSDPDCLIYNCLSLAPGFQDYVYLLPLHNWLTIEASILLIIYPSVCGATAVTVATVVTDATAVIAATAVTDAIVVTVATAVTDATVVTDATDVTAISDASAINNNNNNVYLIKRPY